jgi:hypothetical protein
VIKLSSERAWEWRKLGTVHINTSGASWAATHVALPSVDASAERATWLYFSVRDSAGKSRIARAELRFDGSTASGSMDPTPVLDLGALGAFDDSGVTNSCLVVHQDRHYLYYTGWALGVSVPFYLNSGLAISGDGGRTFRRVSPAPILERNAVDPYLTASPWVLLENGVWRMWYVSGTGWTQTATGARHNYHIRYAESADGVSWARTGRVCLDFAAPDEHAFGRPCVLRDSDGVYRMWYSVRGASYRIGLAESSDGLVWTRMDDRAGIDVSPDGWDSLMIEYPLVFDRNGRRLMLYNGNDYGRTGLGMAERI